MLRALRGTRRLRRALSATAETNAEAAAIIQSHLFDFEDLTRLRTKELQLLLGRIDNATLARSLVEASDRVADRIFTNASDRRALLLREELELYVELTPEEIEGARSEVMAMIRTLYERGDITTYFGSIRRADGEGDTDDEEEEDEEEFEDDIDVEESGESAGDKKGVGSGVAVRRLVALLAAVAVTLLLVALGSLMGGDQSPKKTASRPSVARAAANG
ncbi:MAG: FliG C-terminal domain-containing protein, partial [Candidatus Latescibacteria bacterium]|nr:FliG C-terminal domain-containing protein [Candidatus Latescibacterota bacterium]